MSVIRAIDGRSGAGAVSGRFLVGERGGREFSYTLKLHILDKNKNIIPKGFVFDQDEMIMSPNINKRIRIADRVANGFHFFLKTFLNISVTLKFPHRRLLGIANITCLFIVEKREDEQIYYLQSELQINMLQATSLLSIYLLLEITHSYLFIYDIYKPDLDRDDIHICVLSKI
ncbi:hypothetical protein ACJX0J_017789, partial [Zea mays]